MQIGFLRPKENTFTIFLLFLAKAIIVYKKIGKLLSYGYTSFLAKAAPFRLEFYSDGYEWVVEGTTSKNKGAKLYYFQTACWSDPMCDILYLSNV